MVSIRTSTSPCATLSSQRLPLTIHVNKNQKTKSAIYICARNKSPVSTLSFIMLLLHSRVHSRTLLLSLILSASLCFSLTLTRVRESQLEQSRLTTSERPDSVASAPVCQTGAELPLQPCLSITNEGEARHESVRRTTEPTRS